MTLHVESCGIPDDRFAEGAYSLSRLVRGEDTQRVETNFEVFCYELLKGDVVGDSFFEILISWSPYGF